MFSAGSCFSSEPGGARSALLSGCRTRRHAVISQRRSGRGADADIAARLSQLPIANGAVDAVVLPHTLEFETDPYAVVREADRVLAGEGQLLVLGFRPFSLWGFRSRAISRGYPPGSQAHAGRAVALPTGSNCWVTTSRSRATIYSRRPGAAARRAPAMPSALLRRGWIKPWPAGAYLIKARKRVYTLTPIRPRCANARSASAVSSKPTTTPRSS